ncbi:ATP-binding protein [Roseateles paludis]|uniref:histidine kinase n=1 Tax=Roseateles paludis TaxID=3145238 RepID=A0ABV0G1E1_9BURK
MKSFWPQSLFARNLWLIAGLVVLAQVVNGWAFREAVLRPHVNESVADAARSFEAARQALVLMAPAERAAFVRRFNERAEPDDRPALGRRIGLIERAYIQALERRLGGAEAPASWRLEADGTLSFRVALAEPGEVYWLRVPRPLSGHHLVGRWLLGSASALLLALLGAWLIQRRLNRPLSRLVQASEALGRGQRHVELATDGPTEIAALAHSFNAMSAALARGEQERLLMLGGLSHDLRTPLAKMRLASELLRDGGRSDPALLDSLERGLQDLDGLLTQFLAYVRTAHGDHASREEAPVPLELHALLAEVASLSPHRAATSVVDAERVHLLARPQSLRRLVLNLLVNAQTHGEPPIELACGQAPGGPWLEVRDRGPGIAPERVAALKRPFARGDAARSGPSGSGLGLAIAERLAAEAGAQLLLLPREGGGLVARVEWRVPA